MNTQSPQPLRFSPPKWKEQSDGFRFSRYHPRQWQEFTGRHVEVAGRSFARLSRSVSPGALSSLGSSRCLRCRPELELANSRRAISRRSSPAVRVDDVQVRAAWDARVRKGNQDTL